MEEDQQPQRTENDENSEQRLDSQDDPYIEGDDDEEDLMDEQDDLASSDSELQVKDPSQEGGQLQNPDQVQEEPSTMDRYLKKEGEVVEWIKNHPGQKWVDYEFPCNSSQFYQEAANLPQWGSTHKNLQWKRPDEIIKDPKFIILEQGRPVDVDTKHGNFAASWFIGALTIVGTKSALIEKLIVEKDYFDKGFVSFQFFKNGEWTQVIVDTLLPYQKQQNVRNCLYSSCTNPQQFWIQLMEKAYVKLHKNYEKITRGTILDGLVDLTGGVSELMELSEKENQKVDNNQVWNFLYSFFSQKFLLGCMNYCDSRTVKNAQQGQQGILQNHYYGIIDMRDFPKDNLKLVRIRNPWGNQGVWTGPFCEQADDWEKYKIVKQQLKNVPKTKKTDGSWWMSFTDFMMQFDRVFIGKIFPQAWETYSIEGEWCGKTNGGKCPTNILGDKTALGDKTLNVKQMPQYIQMESDDRWFNNPQFRIKISKDTKIYVSLMQEDEKISGQGYVPVSFMIASTKSRTERIWERPPQNDIIAEINSTGAINNQREITHYLTLRKFEGKNFGIYMIIPNIVMDPKESKKQESRKFYLRLFSPDALDVTQMSQTLETSVQGAWSQFSAGGSRRIQVKDQAKKKGQMKENPSWCKNPQYFLSLKQPTMMKIILRKAGFKKFKGWKIGMTVCRFEGSDVRQIEKDSKKEKGAGHNNLKRLIQQTNQYLEPPVLDNIERKLLVKPQEKFKESIYFSEDVSAMYFRFNPTEGPFIIIPSSDGEERLFNYKLTIFSNSKVDLQKLDEKRNQVLIGKWQEGISAGGCHLNQKEKEASQRTWSMNPKYLLQFKEDGTSWEQPLRLKITLAIAEKNWKKMNPNTVSGMIGMYLMDRQQGKIHYSEDIIVNQTNFLPVKEITMEITLGLDRPINKDGYIIMPSTYESKVQGTFIVSVKAERPFELAPYK